MRAPWDVINLACVWGLSQERGKEAICEETRKVTALAKLKRTSWRGAIDVVYGGEKPKVEDAQPKKKGAPKKAIPQTEANADNLKRKAEPTPEEAEKSLSKREQKRRAKKVRLDGAGGSAADDKTGS